MNKWFVSIFLLPLCFIGGCVSVPVIPKNAMPPVNRSEVFASDYTALTPWLDCLSGMLAHEKKSIKITVDSIRNTFGNEKGMSLPTEFRPFVEQSLSRITNGYQLYDTSRLNGVHGALTGNVLSQGIISGNLVGTVLLGDLAKADYILSGNLYLAQANQSATVSGEIMALGLNGEVKSYDAAVHLITKDAQTNQIVIQHSLKVRIYSSEQGLSVFTLYGGELSQSNTSFYRAPSMIHGLHTLADYLVAATIRDLSAMVFGKSFSVCNREIPGIDKSQLPVRTQLGRAYVEPWFRLVHRQGNICLQPDPSATMPVTDPDEMVEVRFQQYAADITLSNPLGRPMSAHKRAGELFVAHKSLCLPASLLDPRAKNIECLISDSDNRVIGTAITGI